MPKKRPSFVFQGVKISENLDKKSQLILKRTLARIILQQEVLAKQEVSKFLDSCQFTKDDNNPSILELEERMRSHSISAYRQVLRFIDADLEKLEREEHNSQFR